MKKEQADSIVLISLLIGVIAGVFVGLNILAMIKGFSGGLTEVLRELSQRLR